MAWRYHCMVCRSSLISNSTYAFFPFKVMYSGEEKVNSQKQQNTSKLFSGVSLMSSHPLNR